MKKILIADDEPHIRVLLAYALEDLEELGVELLLAGDGEQALVTALRECPDLVLLDVAMPNLNGYEVCQRLKATDADMYIILLTARGQTRDRKRGTEAGADEYVTKPFDPDYIHKQAMTILGLDS